MTKAELISNALKTMTTEQKREAFPPLTRKNFSIRESWLGREQIITFTNNKGQTITYDHDKALNAMLPTLQFAPCWLKRKHWSQSTNAPRPVLNSDAIIEIIEPKPEPKAKSNKAKSTKK